jgi:hypothetical protein
MNKKAMDIHWAEIIGLVLLALFVIFVLLPIFNTFWTYIKKEPNKKVQEQFNSLVKDISAISPNEEEHSLIPFAVNKERVNYQLITTSECKKNQRDDDKCSSYAKLCLVNIEDKEKPICRELEDINFREEDNEKPYTPKGITIAIKKDNTGVVVFG